MPPTDAPAPHPTEDVRPGDALAGDARSTAAAPGPRRTGRRAVLVGLGLAATGLAAPIGRAAAAPVPDPSGAGPEPARSVVPDVLGGLSERQLNLFNANTGEWVSAVYWRDGAYREDMLGWIDWLLRDWREAAIRPVARDTLDILCALTRLVEFDGWINVTSGYRTPRTNALLARTESGAALHSLHLQARAIDFHLPDRRLDFVNRLALDLSAGGVGYYPANHFLHIDNGRVRRWRG